MPPVDPACPTHTAQSPPRSLLLAQDLLAFQRSANLTTPPPSGQTQGVPGRLMSCRNGRPDLGNTKGRGVGENTLHAPPISHHPKGDMRFLAHPPINMALNTAEKIPQGSFRWFRPLSYKIYSFVP